jgi:hypothetical protein
MRKAFFRGWADQQVNSREGEEKVTSDGVSGGAGVDLVLSSRLKRHCLAVSSLVWTFAAERRP